MTSKEFVDNIKLDGITFNQEKENVWICKFKDSNLVPKLFSKFDNDVNVRLDNEVSEQNLDIETFRWTSVDNKLLITIKADYPNDNYSCTVCGE